MGGGAQLRSRSSFSPWNRPQSIKSCCPSKVTKNFEPVTPPAAPRNCSDNLVFDFTLATPKSLKRSHESLQIDRAMSRYESRLKGALALELSGFVFPIVNFGTAIIGRGVTPIVHAGTVGVF